MMIECRREPVCISEAIITAFSQAHAEVDIIVPDTKPDITKVLQVDAKSVAASRECAEDSITVEGKVYLNILYVGEEGTVNSICYAKDFKHNIEVAGAMPDMGLLLECEIDNVEYEVINSRKITVRTDTAFDARVTAPLDIDVITNVTCPGCEELRKKIKPNNVASKIEERISIKELLPVPPGKPGIGSVLKLDVQMGAAQLKTAANKLIIKGTLNATTLFIGDMDENAIQFMEHEIPFTEVIDVDGIDDGMEADIFFTIGDTELQIEEDSDGDCRAMALDITVFAFGRVLRCQELEILEDIFSTEIDLCVAKGSALLDKIAFETKTQITINDVATVGADLPDIIQVYNAIAKPYLTSVRIENGKVCIEGIADIYILYLSDDASYPVYTYKHESSFVQYIDAENLNENMLCDANIRVEHISYNFGIGHEMQLRLILNAEIKVLTTESIEFVSEITEGDELPKIDRPPCGIKIYFAQKGDRLWDVAKKYKVSPSRLMTENDICDEMDVIAGKQIVIPQ